MTTTITTLSYANGVQFIEFTSINGHQVTVQGELINTYLECTGELVLVHDERDADDNIVHEIYIRH